MPFCNFSIIMFVELVIFLETITVSTIFILKNFNAGTIFLILAVAFKVSLS